MEKLSKSDFLARISKLKNSGELPDKIVSILLSFLQSYEDVLGAKNRSLEEYLPIFDIFLSCILKQLDSPHPFEPYHKRICAPFDYYQFGLDFLLPLIELEKSQVYGKSNLEKIQRQIEAGENVIFLANHQIEADPQVMSILLQNQFPSLAEDMIFVAGHRVVTDPFAIPFSMGRNLLCIYSKKHIDTPPEKKHSKQIHNKRTMQKMSELLSEGGHSIYVAPSGGRDRMEKNGEIKVAPFDPQSIEMFYLMAKRSKKKNHFYPLALSTYDILPPPETTEKELGELRVTKGGAVYLSFLDELDMENFPGSDHPEKHMRRKLRADCIYNQVCEEYKRIT